MRIAIVGAPRTGKTTAATELAKRTGLPLISTGKRSEALDIYTRFFIDLPWDQVPHVVRDELKKHDGWILEGTQSARVLRKWLDEEPDTLKLDRVHCFFNAPWVVPKPGAKAMGKGIRETIWPDVRRRLQAMGVEIVEGMADA